MTKYKIKRVKEYLRDGLPQFIVLKRYDIEGSVRISFLENENEIQIGSIQEGTIETVQRIKDNHIFKHGDAVLTSTCFGYVIEFLDDLVHCYVAKKIDQAIRKEKIPIDKIEINNEIMLEEDFYEYKEGDPYD